jgi:uncharacterized protein YqhQ
VYCNILILILLSMGRVFLYCVTRRGSTWQKVLLRLLLLLLQEISFETEDVNDFIAVTPSFQ